MPGRGCLHPMIGRFSNRRVSSCTCPWSLCLDLLAGALPVVDKPGTPIARFTLSRALLDDFDFHCSFLSVHSLKVFTSDDRVAHRPARDAGHQAWSWPASSWGVVHACVVLLLFGSEISSPPRARAPLIPAPTRNCSCDTRACSCRPARGGRQRSIPHRTQG